MVVTLGKDGTPYLAVDDKLVVERGGAHTDLGPITLQQGIQPSDDGALISIIADNTLEMRDNHGRVLWRRPVWNALHVTFSRDDRFAVLSTRGGLIELDARTGERVAVSCGYDFALRNEAPRSMPNNVAPACED